MQYKYWESESVIKKHISPRPWAKRFQSEKHYLEKICHSGISVLDVGCACGDLYHGLAERFGDILYTGIDVANPLIAIAQRLYPLVSFYHGNLIEEGSDILADQQYELVTATGVFQHEENYCKLFDRMLSRAKKYMLFDVKLLDKHDTICDIDKAYCDHPQRIPYIAFHIDDFLSFLREHVSDDCISLYGYFSGVNSNVCLPSSVNEEVCSCHVLIGKQKLNQELRIWTMPESYCKHLSSLSVTFAS